MPSPNQQQPTSLSCPIVISVITILLEKTKERSGMNAIDIVFRLTLQKLLTCRVLNSRRTWGTPKSPHANK
jgi:hypothetical protein